VAAVFTLGPGETHVCGDQADRAGAIPPAPSVCLGWLPVASLLLAADGRATAVNPAWLALSSMADEDCLGHGWLDAVVAAEREAFGTHVRLAAALGTPGRGGCHLTAAGGRWSRWWWQPTPAGDLVCVAVTEDSQAQVIQETRMTDLASAVVHRAFRAGLILESAAGLSRGPATARLRDAVDELDGLIREVRDAVFRTYTASPDDD